jgi:hypothetical protein
VFSLEAESDPAFQDRGIRVISLPHTFEELVAIDIAAAFIGTTTPNCTTSENGNVFNQWNRSAFGIVEDYREALLPLLSETAADRMRLLLVQESKQKATMRWRTLWMT